MSRLLRYLTVLSRWRKLILLNTISLTVIAAVVSLLLPCRYRATAQLLPPPEDDVFGISSILGSGLGSSLNRLRGGLIGASTPSDLMVRILESRTVIDAVIDSCGFMGQYGFKQRERDAARKALGKMTTLLAADEGVVSISVEAKTPGLAADIANCYVARLDEFLRQSNISRGRNMRIFIERRLGEVDSSLRVAQESLRVFQERHRVVRVDEEVEAAVDAYATLKSDLMLREAQLLMVEQVSSPDNPMLIDLRREVESFRSGVHGLESGTPVDGFGVGFGLSFARLPAVAAEYVRRYLAQKIQEEAYSMLYQQYEYARIIEARDTPALTILDEAVPPERRSFPRRMVLIAAVLLFSLVAGGTLAFGAEYFDRLRVRRPAEYEGWRELTVQVRGDIRRLVHLPSPKKK